MTRRNNAKTPVDEITETILDELFTSVDDDPSIALPLPCCVAIGRIFVAAAQLGGMVSLYRGGPNNSFIVSVRFGDRKRAVEIDDDEGSVTVLEHLANGVEDAWAKVHSQRRAARIAQEPLKADTPV